MKHEIWNFETLQSNLSGVEGSGNTFQKLFFRMCWKTRRVLKIVHLLTRKSCNLKKFVENHVLVQLVVEKLIHELVFEDCTIFQKMIWLVGCICYLRDLEFRGFG